MIMLIAGIATVGVIIGGMYYYYRKKVRDYLAPVEEVAEATAAEYAAKEQAASPVEKTKVPEGYEAALDVTMDILRADNEPTAEETKFVEQTIINLANAMEDGFVASAVQTVAVEDPIVI